MHSERPSVIDLFCGCGGMSLGFAQAGFTVLEGFDAWPAAVDTYRANLDHPATVLDLSDFDATVVALSRFEDASGFPLIVGGPPCQDFSSSGSRVEGSRAALTALFAAVVALFRPRVFVMENVARAQHAQTFQRAVTALRDVGYAVGMTVLDASRCGVPQTRKRLFTVGFRDDASALAVTMKALELGQSTSPLTVREFFGDELGIEHYYRHPRSYTRRGVFSVDEPSPTIRGVNRPVPATYRAHPGDTADAHTCRSLTTVERARVQTFPPSFAFPAARTATEQMIGNAVPPVPARFVAEAVLTGLDSAR